MEKYSVAIRTLGTKPELLLEELESIFAQSVPPEQVFIYIAEGYPVPDFRVAREVYVPVPKGMVAQRALKYWEVQTPLVLLMDDDVVLGKDAAKDLLNAMERHALDCIAPDVFHNHQMSTKGKLYAALTNFTYPHRDPRFAFKIHRNGAFSYINKPDRNVYLSQSAGGPCSLWRKDKLMETRIKDETWLDSIGFAYNDDTLEFYKLYKNGGRLGVLFNADVEHRGGQTSSGAFHRSGDVFRRRARAVYLVWLRSILEPTPGRWQRALTRSAFWLRMAWQLPVHVVAGIAARKLTAPADFVRGLRDGIRYSRTPAFLSLPPYIRHSENS